MSDVKEIISFLTDLSENNNKGWFHANRQRYTDAKKMAEALCAELIEGIRGFDPYVGTLSPQDCLFRIFRDTRFAKDKSPYRPGFGMFVARGGKKTEHHGYFFQIGAQSSNPHNHDAFQRSSICFCLKVTILLADSCLLLEQPHI